MFYCLPNFLLYRCNNIFLSSPVLFGHVICFQFFDSINDATMNHITDQSLFVFLLASGEILVFLIKETYVVCATPFFFFLTQNKCDAWSWAAFFDSEVLSMNSRPKGLHDPWSWHWWSVEPIPEARLSICEKITLWVFKPLYLSVSSSYSWTLSCLIQVEKGKKLVKKG